MKDATRAVHGGRDPHRYDGTVNMPVHRASTVLAPTWEAWKALDREESADAVTYGVHGTPDTYAFEDVLTALEGGHRTRLCASGLEACTLPLLCCLGTGDHLLLPDNAYGPTTRFARRTLKRLGVETTWYDPLIGGGIRDLLRPNTRVVFTESPGSLTFEVQDIPAIAEEAKKAGATVMMDNTWASPLYFKPLDHGVDISIQAVTKYVGGHADLIMGAVTATRDAYPAIREGWKDIGVHCPPDAVALAARGLRTLDVRLARHAGNGLKVAEWLMDRPEVAEVIHPAMPHDPGYALWSRDFLGASSLFAFVLADGLGTDAHLSALLDDLDLFGMGDSWGGFESLLVPKTPRRSVTDWPRPGRAGGQLMRIHVGLEDPDDLIADLEAGFARMKRV